MKKRFTLIPLLLVLATLAAGCRSHANNGDSPSTTTAPSESTVASSTMESTEEATTTPTVDNGNGPLDSTGGTAASTGSTTDSTKD